MRDIFITGASGFVGAALCRRLLAEKRRIIAASRTGTTFAGAQNIIFNSQGAENMLPHLTEAGVVIHLAARVHVMRDEINDPMDVYRKINVEATVKLARQAIDAGVKRFVFVSSVKVNGEATMAYPFGPSDQPSPLDPYGKSKYEAECALQDLASPHGMELVIVRPPLVYGPGVRANFLKLMQLVKGGVPLPFRNVVNRRSIVALDNLIDLLILVADHPCAAGHTFMVSDGNDVSTPDLIRMISCSMGITPRLFPVPMRTIEKLFHLVGKGALTDRILGSLQVDISETRKILGWAPVIATEIAVQKTVMQFLGGQVD